jgi:NTE family protein
VNQNGLYDSVNVTIQTQRASDIEESQVLTIPVLGIQANSTPELVLAAGGWGSNLIGPHFTGSLRVRFVQQFEYDLKVQGSYGAWRKQFVPELLFSRIHGGDLAFFAGADLLRSNNLVYQSALAQYLDEPDLIVQSENRMNANLQVRWTPEAWWVLNSGVQIGQDDLTTAQTKRLRTPIRNQSYAAVNTMEVFSEWKKTKTSDHYFFDEKDNQWGGRIAFRSLLINNSGQSNAPLYSRAHGYAATSKTFLGLFTAGLNGSAGIDGRSGPDGWEYPDSLAVVLNHPSDPAIRNHYKMHIDATPFSSMLPIPQLSSFHFIQVGGKMGIHWKGNGFWVFGSWIHDYSAERNYGLLEDRFSVEPLIRAHFSSLEFLLGLHKTIAKKDISNILDSEDWLAILQVGLVNF